MNRNEGIQNIDKIIVILLGVLLVAFPLFFLTTTTEAYVLPKQALLAFVVLISLLLSGVKLIAEAKVKLKRTPFDLPFALLTIVTLLSAVFSLNRADALTAFVPLLLSVLGFFLIVNNIRNTQQFHFVITAFISGAALTALWAIFSYLKIYLLPMPLTHAQDFTPFGSLFDQALYFAFSLPVGWYLSKPVVHHIREKSPIQKIAYPVLTAVVAIGLILSVLQIVNATNANDKLLTLPIETGIQTALSTISQDTGRVIPGLLFGSGYGTFITDFSRFKPASFNLDQNLWFITFFRSSSFAMELLTTTGILGFAAYLYLVFRVLKSLAGTKNGGFLTAIILSIIASFILPFSFNVLAIFFFLLALFSVYKGLFDSVRFFDIEIDLVAFRKGLLEAVSLDNDRAKKANKALPVTFFIVILIFDLIIGFFSIRYVMADMLFQKSLLAAAANKGVDTYNYEVNAIQVFPYRDGFYRIYSQTNLALANSIAAAQPAGSTPNQQTQQTVYTLIQQAISAGRSATSIAPLTYFNWENLSGIYRSLIGFGQNADTFAIAAEQQAVTLNPNDPQVYINLGGIYYQLAKWDDAQHQFQLSINLKNDYANAHYNLGHSLESKGDLQGALAEYQIVLSLVQANPANVQKISAEISAVQAKIGQAQNPAANQQGSTAEQPPLGISKPATQLPEQKPPVKLPNPK